MKQEENIDEVWGVLLGQKSQGKGENNKGGVVWGSVKFGSMLLLFANSVNESYW
jgi:hypothetical protein